MDRLTWAIETAAIVHQGQVDKSGTEYILHCLAVMNMVAPDRDLMIVAVLHDAIEDYPGSGMARRGLMDKLYAELGDRIYAAIEAITHRQGEGYDEYIERVAQNYLARRVKIADLTHNMDPRRIPASQIVDKDFARWDKYRRALIRLECED